MMARPALPFWQYCAALPVIMAILIVGTGNAAAHNKSLSFFPNGIGRGRR